MNDVILFPLAQSQLLQLQARLVLLDALAEERTDAFRARTDDFSESEERWVKAFREQAE